MNMALFFHAYCTDFIPKTQGNSGNMVDEKFSVPAYECGLTGDAEDEYEYDDDDDGDGDDGGDDGDGGDGGDDEFRHIILGESCQFYLFQPCYLLVK